MCGIVGIAGEITQDLKKTFHQMLVVDQLRGEHSTGVLSVRNHDGHCKITKVLGGPHNLDDSKSYHDQFTDYNKVMLGHNRYATVGKITTNNAHPFNFEKVVGVHNGSLRNYTRLDGYGKYNVDSEVLYASINDIGLEASLDKITGAYALAYWDKEASEMVFIRNDERSLYMGFTENQKSLLWASEDWMITAMAARNGVKMQEVFLLKANTLVTVAVPTMKTVMKLHVKQDVKGGAGVVATSVTPFRQTGSQSSTTTTVGSTEQRTTSGTLALVPVDKTITQTATTTQETVESHESPIGRDIVEFVCGMKGCDSFGAKFVNLVRLNDTRTYRLYLKREDYGQFDSGDRVAGQVNSLKVENGTKMVYKIANLSAINLTKKAKADMEKLKSQTNDIVKALREQTEIVEDEPLVLGEVTEEGFEEEPTFITSAGTYLGKEAFLKKHQFCSYCTTNIDPDAGYRFIKDEILCDGCMSDRVLIDSLS